MKPHTLDNADDRREERVKFATEIGKHLRIIREKNGISQENPSLKAGYYRTYVGRLNKAGILQVYILYGVCRTLLDWSFKLFSSLFDK